MDYTQSDAFVTHGGTGHRMHQDDQPVTTEVSANDLNMVVWSLMEVLNRANVPGMTFDPDTAATYQRLALALDTRTVGDNLLRYIPPGSWAAAIAGTFDCSSHLQACIDANKGKTVIIPDGLFQHAGITLSGSSYDNTKIVCFGELLLKQRPNAVTNNFAGAWVGLVVQDCDGVMLHYRGHGNRAVQPDEEHCHLVVIAGATNVKMPVFFSREMRGDGLYISQSDPLSSSALPKAVSIGTFHAANSSDDGRNALSVISVSGLTIGSFTSIGVGSVVGGVRQPGGLDIEPNASYHVVEDVAIGPAVIRSAGGTCFGINGRDSGTAEDWIVRRVSVASLDSINTLGVSATQGTFAAFIQGCSQVAIRGNVSHTATQGTGLWIDKAKRCNIDVQVELAEIGAILGSAGWVRDATRLNIAVARYVSVGIRAIGVTNCRLTGRVMGATSSSSTFAVQLRSAGRALTQSGVIYSIDAPYDGFNARGYRNEPTDTVAFSNCFLEQCDLTGYASYVVALEGMGISGMLWQEVRGITDAAAMPGNGAWPAGVFVKRTAPAKDGNSMSILGWHRAITGSAHVDGTDWYTSRVSLVSPAV